MMPHKINKSVLFDMDGVLVNNTPVHIEAFAVWCKRRGVDYDNNSLEGLFGRRNDEIFTALLHRKIEGEELRTFADEKERIYREIFAATIRPADGLIDYLTALKAEGFTLAVGSSGPRENVDFVLDRCGIRDYFDATVNGDLVTRGKPDPEIFQTAARMLAQNPENCLVIEDAPVGIQAAHRAGMKVVAITSTLPAAQLSGYNALIDSLREINVEMTYRILQ